MVLSLISEAIHLFAFCYNIVCQLTDLNKANRSLITTNSHGEYYVAPA